ncbi:GH116 family glycosyl-hydrolase [Actinocrispum wychmicini]|uniref:Beta-glucocerebrosidase 2-like protein n=1 Tax=Actinocrispum wychmicini TaxID=1213861 RepID=A0A4R2IX49_9PSEU|nr:GH116 family glycosyl-hydrolase [Actinocrispum wychmicini]TCO48828.1 beta-glucocerebrosidase 2-like protein [Actinocrispum wychmicini]
MREQPCCPDGGCDTRHVNRRRFFTLSAATASAAILAATARDALAAGIQPSQASADKRLSVPLADLLARGEPTSYTGSDLRLIGMPVGGGCCGQVYLGGDGRLWYWDVDNGPPAPGADFEGTVYANPRTPFFPFGNGFVIKANGDVRAVDSTGFTGVTFTGQYPVGRVDYHDDSCPVAVRLDAYSPFIPGETDDSTLPCTVLEYTVTNTTKRAVAVELTGWLENPVSLRSRFGQPVSLSSAAIGGAGQVGVQFTAAQLPAPQPRPDIVFEDWEQPGYPQWTVEGDAFGAGPLTEARLPDYMRRFGPLHVQGTQFVTSHNFIAANGDVGKADTYLGKLTSREFTVERRYLMAWVGGGNHPGVTCLNVVVDGAVVGSLTGDDIEPMRLKFVDLVRYQGKTAHIEIVDGATGGWGHVNVDTISFADLPKDRPALDQLTDGGTFALTSFEPKARSRPSLAQWDTPSAIATSGPGPGSVDAGLGTIAGAVTVPMSLKPQESRTVRFALSWYFPIPDRDALSFLSDVENLRRHYATRFGSAADVAKYLAGRIDALSAATKLWVKTWYADSTLPYWFLERTLATASTLATSTCMRFGNGRFYAWEGVGCCAGTCEHVWNYAESIGRLFPALERDERERVDLGIGFDPRTGQIGNRAEADMVWAADGQCGTILRIYREHQMCPDDSFLRRVWPRVKLALNWVMSQDSQSTGTLTGPQPNTLDAVWHGEVAWMTGMYNAALLAGVAMASELGDLAFARRCRQLADAGFAAMDRDLWTGEYFIQIVDPRHPEDPNSNRGCHIDQLFGQSLAWQLDLPRVFDRQKSQIALRSIYRYNFVPDPDAYRRANTAIPWGRWFAMAGEPAVIMTTFPHGGAAQANGSPPAVQAKYFNESWTGQEYQYAANLVYEGLLDEGMNVTRAVHDRYAGSKRNPYNEIECSDHYTRAMAGYGVFLAACGFSCHSPRGRLAFAPKVTPEDFAAAFTAAGGWGRYRQQRTDGRQTSTVEVRYGRVRVTTIAVEANLNGRPQAQVQLDGQPLTADVVTAGSQIEVTLRTPVTLAAGQTLVVTLGR